MNKIGVVLSLAVLFWIAAGDRLEAQGCHVEPMPAATLLLPYFEVDLDHPGTTTRLTVNNADASPVLVKTEIWSDLGVPLFGFHFYLRGHDMLRINMADILVKGKLPKTIVSGVGAASCNGFIPPPALSPESLVDYQHALTGLSGVFQNKNWCAGLSHGDNIARGYMTLDTVNSCSTMYRGTPGTFQPGGTGIFTNQNVLWGDYSYSSGDRLNNLVHIRADKDNPATATQNAYTFYGTFLTPKWSAADNRVPLATNFALRFFSYHGVGSDLIVWRDPKSGPFLFPCGMMPDWYPLGQGSITAFDEDGHATKITTKAFPIATQRVRVGSSALPVPYTSGWLYLDLNHPGQTSPLDAQAAQAWVTVDGVDAIRLDSACNAMHPLSFPW